MSTVISYLTAAGLGVDVVYKKKDPRCLEYIVVHELVHLLERGHGEKFVTLMDQVLPSWRARRDELNEAPLGHEECGEDWRA